MEGATPKGRRNLMGRELQGLKQFAPKPENIKREKERLVSILNELPPEKLTVANGLIMEAAFMRATLIELRAYIKENGVVEEMCQGAYSITRESPAIRSYNAMVSKYDSVCKSIFSLLPKEIVKPKMDDLDAFLNGNS